MKYIILIASMTLGSTLFVLDKPALADAGEAVSIGKTIHLRDVPPLPKRKPVHLLPPLPAKKPDMNELARRRAISKILDEMVETIKLAKDLVDPVTLLMIMIDISVQNQGNADPI